MPGMHLAAGTVAPTVKDHPDYWSTFTILKKLLKNKAFFYVAMQMDT